jgi:3-methyladenine DNA glycosylase AlkC
LARKAARDERDLWKDHVDRTAVKKFAAVIASVYPRFDPNAFVKKVCDRAFLKLELKDRLNRIATELRPFFPDDYTRATEILISVAPKAPGFLNWVLTAYVEQFGQDEFDTSVATLKELTKFGTAEFAIRPFIINHTEQMLPILHGWALDPNEHVRRLAAEGSRPRGVWVAHIDAFKKDPTPVLELLEKLKADRSKYVQKAVANNLNDISREHPERVIRTAAAWIKNGDDNTAWVVKRACRTLIKQGHPKVFPIFGFTNKPKVKVSPIRLSTKKLTIGGELSFSFKLSSAAKDDQQLALSERTIAAGETVVLAKKHSFRPATTRKLYPGKHGLEIMVNGVSVGRIDFTLSS